MKRSPTLEGFKAVFRRPSLAFAEISWRWSCGFAGAALLIVASVEYLDTLPVSPADMLLLRTNHPLLVARALGHIAQGSAPRTLRAGLLLGIALSVAWVIVAALGRLASVKALLSYFVERSPTRSMGGHSHLLSLVGLNSLRAAATLAAAIGAFGAVLLGGVVSAKDDPSPANSVLVCFMVLVLVALAWLVLNWFLSLASVFAVAEGEDTFGAIARAADFCRQRTWPVLAASFWLTAARCGFFIVASGMAILLLSTLVVLPGFVVSIGLLLVTLLYFAVADFLYVARSAAYLYIAIGPETTASPVESQDQPEIPVSRGSLPSARIDGDELILSDFPLPVSS